ncbi:MAG: hypothetical protein HYS26_03585 [Candidatus Kaiserbacteria bacterium]|nr:MAG: hypothetical protein HYS26_03585 [Candidatus Kaiserbacteria bacterium]
MAEAKNDFTVHDQRVRVDPDNKNLGDAVRDVFAKLKPSEVEKAKFGQKLVENAG